MPYVQHTLALRRNVSASHRLRCCGLAVFQIGSDTELASREAPQALYGLAARSYRPTDWRRPDASGKTAAISGSV